MLKNGPQVRNRDLEIVFSFLRVPLQKPIAGRSNILPEGAPQCPFAAQNRIPDTLHGSFCMINKQHGLNEEDEVNISCDLEK